MNQKNKHTISMIAKIGLMTALSAIMSFPPFGTIKIPVFMVDVTLAHLPTIIIALLEGPLWGGVCGLFLGIISMVRCLTEPAGLNVFIWNPLISVLPRILVGLSAGMCYTAAKSGKKPWAKTTFFDTAALSLSAAVGSAVNTVGVLGMLYVVYAKDLTELLVANDYAQTAGAFLIGIAAAAGVAEMLIIAALSTIIVKALRRAGYKKG